MSEKSKSAQTQFKPGQSGNPKGRPKGSRNKLGEAFIGDLYQDWEQHGKDAIVRAPPPTKIINASTRRTVLPAPSD